MPPAPPTFSTTICCFKISPRRGRMPLPATSVGPPAANGTIIVTGRVGQLSAPVVPGVANNRATPTVASNPVSRPKVTFVSMIPSCFHAPYVRDVPCREYLFCRDWNRRAAPGHHSTPHHPIRRRQRDTPAGRLSSISGIESPPHSSPSFVATSRHTDGELSLVKSCSPQRLEF